GGGGLEYRWAASLFNVCLSSTYHLPGIRQKEGEIIHRNLWLWALLVDLRFTLNTAVRLSVFSLNFRGGDYRESYYLALQRRLSDQVNLTFTGGLDSGGRDERVFNSLLSVFFTFRFPPPPAPERPPEDQ
ncbi:MAG: hypothetical protein JXB45_01140, partial [Candidatus Krumholzibacteriota bacterium]|nr:hypothetical protein [Candidatus Krumholzibacteriota bacterium]